MVFPDHTHLLFFKQPLIDKKGLHAGQKYYRMLQGGALSVLKNNFRSSLEWLLETEFTELLPEWVKAVGQKLSGDLWRPSCHGKILVSRTALMEHCGWFDM